ncbi:hypothetical protein BON30_04350 [Cystobacter ferrugineus]|uniref:Urease accessory protein UreD n=1 Tax=Cystobacter ferrugineus TaxID=83449 RepID=A0A1L9BJG2_9BACT|nr:hypothetical protein BON30_04350 [Cystobacter ferrugineus]
MPDPTVCFTDACYSQRQDIQLAPDASLVLMDLVNAGRSANGERWACASFSSSLRVHQGGRALLDERWLLEPLHGHLPERLGRFDALGTVLLIGPALAAAREALSARAGALPVIPPRRAHLLHQPAWVRGAHPPGGGHFGGDPAPVGPGVVGLSSLPPGR